MSSNGNWTQLLTLGAVVLGGIITMSTTWLANSQQNMNQMRERREDRLMPIYLSLQMAIRDLTKLLEDYALAGFPHETFFDTEAQIKAAFETLKQVTYKIDFMSSPRIVFDTELLEDSITQLIGKIGFRLRLMPLAAVPEAQSQDYVRSELRGISERRMQLLEIMRADLALTERRNRFARSFQRITPRSHIPRSEGAAKYGPPKRDQDGFLIDDGRYH
jgi:hypothetical protein